MSTFKSCLCQFLLVLWLLFLLLPENWLRTELVYVQHAHILLRYTGFIFSAPCGLFLFSVDNCHCGTYGQSKILQYFLSFSLYALSIRIHIAFFYCTMLVCARMFDHLSASELLNVSICRVVFKKKACIWHIAKYFLSTIRACSWRWQRLNRCLFTGH